MRYLRPATDIRPDVEDAARRELAEHLEHAALAIQLEVVTAISMRDQESARAPRRDAQGERVAPQRNLMG